MYVYRHQKGLPLNTPKHNKMATDNNVLDSAYLLIGNIPTEMHSSDLRSFFSQFVEKGAFRCFHYKHRPEVYNESTQSQAGLSSEPVGVTTGGDSRSGGELSGKVSTCCCFVAIHSEHCDDFIRQYQEKQWALANGSLMPKKVRIAKIRLPESTAPESSSSFALSSGDSGLPSQERAVGKPSLLLELNPPALMPNGNVGTPTRVFIELINACKLPTRVISKLKLEFPKSRAKRRYGAVSHSYGPTRTHHYRHEEPQGNREGEQGRLSDEEGKGIPREEEGIAEDEEQSQLLCRDGTGPHSDTARVKERKRKRRRAKGPMPKASSSPLPGKRTSPPSDNEEEAEEWERFEAYHQDIDKQERTKPRLFENEMEVVWEKGGSGLVFYTDANFWKSQEGDSDHEPDEWDLDLGCYYDPAGGDKDSKDMIEMNREKRLRQGDDVPHPNEIGGFERHTKGVGGRILRKSGWEKGKGLGRTVRGIAQPLETEGQDPHSRRGVGYFGPKLLRGSEALKAARRKKKAGEGDRLVMISTVYDSREERGQEGSHSVLRAPSSHQEFKYRDRVVFTKGPTLHQDT